MSIFRLHVLPRTQRVRSGRIPKWEGGSRIVLPALLLLAALLSSCAERERSNPLDPLNPHTHGLLPGFRAVAQDGMVELRWDPLTDLTDIDEVSIYRRQEDESGFYLLARLVFSPRDRGYLDSTAANGVTYYYHLGLNLRGGSELPSVSREVPATPGRQRCWALAAGTGELMLLSPDGREVRKRVGGFAYPWAIRIDTGRARVWMADADAGNVFALDADGEEIARFGGFWMPVALALRTDGTCLVVDAIREEVYILDCESRTRVLLISTGLSHPSDMNVNPADGTVWISEQDPARVSLWKPEGAFLKALASGGSPRRIVFSRDGTAWVSDPQLNLVRHFDAQGKALRSVPVPGAPFDLAFEERRKLIWVTRMSDGRVSALSPEGEEVVGIAGFEVPLAVFLNESRVSYENACWVSDAATGRIYRFDLDGGLEGVLSGELNPVALAVDPGGPQ